MNIGSNANKLMTPDELAEFLAISKQTVYRLVDSRKIPFYKVNGGLRFKRDDIAGYLETNRTEPIIM